MMTAIEVRRATPNDVAAIVPLWREMMELHQRIEPANWTMVADADDIFRSYLAKCLEDAEHMIAVAVCGRQVLGFIHASKAYRPPVITPQAGGAINGIAVAAKARRQGIGRRLVEDAMRWFTEQGLTVARLGYAINNPLSGPFWLAMGFQPYQVSAMRQVDVAAPAPALRLDPTGSYFASVAETYDRLQPIVAGPWYERGLAMATDLVPHESNEEFSFVELGCGTATLTDRVLARFSHASAIAVDSEPAMLTVARQKLEKYGKRAQVR